MIETFESLERLAPLIAQLALMSGALWVGTLFAVSWFSGRAPYMAEGNDVAALATELHRRWAVPYLIGCVGFAFCWLCVAPQRALTLRVVGGPALAFVVLLWVHTSVGSRAARMAQGSVLAARGEGMRRFALVVVSLAMLMGLIGRGFVIR